MHCLQAHCKHVGTHGRRLAAEINRNCSTVSVVLEQGYYPRPSRVYAADTVGSGVDRLHEVRRRRLKQSFELDSAVPQGHPDNAAAALPGSNSSSSSSSSSNGRTRSSRRSTVSSSNGNGTAAATAGGARRSRAATGHRNNGVSAAAALAAAAAVSSTSPQQQQQQQPPEIPQADASSDDPDTDRELQAEFHESHCCQDVLDIIADELNQFSPFHTVTALNRLTKLGRNLPWQERTIVLQDTNFILLLDRLVRQAPLLNPFQVATSMYSCAVLQIPLYSLKTGSFSLLLPALEAAIVAQLKQFNDRDVSSTLYAYAQLKPHTGVDAQQKQQSHDVILQLAGHAQSLIVKKDMSGQSISMVLWSLATLHNNSPGSGIATGSGAVVAAAAHHLIQPDTSYDRLGSQVLANSIWAAAKLGNNDLQLLQKGCDWMARNPQKCRVQEMLNVLWAAGAARYRPKLLGTLAKHVAGQSKALKPADIASLFHVLGIFGFDFDMPANKPLLQTLLPRACELLPQMKPSEVTSLYWGLGMTKQVDNTIFQQLTAVVAKLQQQASAAQQQQQQRQQQRVVQMPASLQRQAFQAFIAAKLEDVDVSLPADVTAAFKSAWLESSSRGHSSSSSRSRGQQQLKPMLEELQWMLQAMKVKAEVNTRSKLDHLLTVDVELMASGQRLVAIQILGELEVDSQGHKLGPVVWEEDLLHRNGYEQVYWLQVSDYKRCPKDKRPRFFADVLKRVGVNPQERLIAAAEAAWVAAGGKIPAAAAAGAAAGGWGMVGAGGIKASEADVLMQDKGRESGGGYAAGGGRGSRRAITRRRR